SAPPPPPAPPARAAAPQSRRACTSSAFRSVPTRRPRSALRSGCATRRNHGATTSTGTSSSTPTTRIDVGRLTSVRPLWAIEGGRVTLEGDGFPVDPRVPHVRLGAEPARIAAASSSSLTVLVPGGLDGGSTAIRVDELPGETAFVEVGAPLVTGVHHVDSPAYDRHGNLYVTFSGSRGQQAPVAIFVFRPAGTRDPFLTDVANPTYLAFA